MKHPTARLRLIVAKDYRGMSRLAAEFIQAAVESKPDLLLCASAGGTPTGIYERLATLHDVNSRLFKNLRVLQIDEWGGLSPKNPATCRMDLETKLLTPLGIDRSRFESFRTENKEP